MNNFQPFDTYVTPRDLRSDRRQLTAIALAVTLMYAITLAVQLIVVVLVKLFVPWIQGEGWYVIVASNGPMYVVAMPLAVLCYRISVAQPPKETKKMSVLAFLGLIPICFALTYVGNIIGTVVNGVIESVTGEPVVNDLQEIAKNMPLWCSFLFMGILAPIFEEIFYRKLVIDRLLRFGELPAVLISGILFGLIHANFSQFFYAAMLGTVFGYIYIRTGRLRYTVALHMILNIVGGVYTNEILKMINLDLMAEKGVEYLMQNPIPFLLLLGYYLFIGVCFVAAPIALVLLWKQIRFRKSEQPLSARDWVDVAVKNPAVWIFAAVIVLMFVF